VLVCLILAEKISTACDLPVCDIPAELKTLEAKGQAYRFQFISKLRASYSKEKDEQKLNNLLLFAKDAVGLIVSLKDEDYVLREAKALKDQILFLLLQWVWRDCQKLSDAYAELAGEAQRYAAIDYFLRKVPEFKNEELIKNLVCFAQSAERSSRLLSDPEYISRHAVSLSSALSTQLLEVFNGWEGVFNLTQIEGPLNEELDKLRLILFSSGGDLGIVAAITHPTLPPMVFQNVSFEGVTQNLVSRQSFASKVPSVIEMKFDEKFLNVEGSVLDPVHLEKTHFTAQRIVAVQSMSEKPCDENEIVGQYETHVAGHFGIFSLQKIGTAQYAGVFSTEGGAFRLPFSFGRYNAGTGRVSFVNMQANVPLVWRLTAERDPNSGCSLRGWGLSSFNSVSYPLILQKRKKQIR
jgi:hypothetical protein